MDKKITLSLLFAIIANYSTSSLAEASSLSSSSSSVSTSIISEAPKKCTGSHDEASVAPLDEEPSATASVNSLSVEYIQGDPELIEWPKSFYFPNDSLNFTNVIYRSEIPFLEKTLVLTTDTRAMDIARILRGEEISSPNVILRPSSASALTMEITEDGVTMSSPHVDEYADENIYYDQWKDLDCNTADAEPVNCDAIDIDWDARKVTFTNLHLYDDTAGYFLVVDIPVFVLNGVLTWSEADEVVTHEPLSTSNENIEGSEKGVSLEDLQGTWVSVRWDGPLLNSFAYIEVDGSIWTEYRSGYEEESCVKTVEYDVEDLGGGVLTLYPEDNAYPALQFLVSTFGGSDLRVDGVTRHMWFQRPDPIKFRPGELDDWKQRPLCATRIDI